MTAGPAELPESAHSGAREAYQRFGVPGTSRTRSYGSAARGRLRREAPERPMITGDLGQLLVVYVNRAEHSCDHG